MNSTLNELVSQSFFWVDTAAFLTAIFVFCTAILFIVDVVKNIYLYSFPQIIIFILSLLGISSYVLYLYYSLYSEILLSWL